MNTPRPVTGPDGDNPIDRAALLALFRSSPDADIVRSAVIALGLIAATEDERTSARTRCAAYNARHAGKNEIGSLRGADRIRRRSR